MAQRMAHVVVRGVLASAIIAAVVLGGTTIASATGTRPTATTLASSSLHSVAGQTSPVVTYTAIVAPQQYTTGGHPTTPTATSPAPTGTVEFYDGGTPITGCTASSLSALTGATKPKAAATCTEPASSMTAGVHVITATYGGNGTYQTSSAPGIDQTVTADATTVAVTNAGSAPAANPSSPGVAVTYTATITPTTATALKPTGTVKFLDGATTIGCATQSISTSSPFVATCTEASGSMTVGSHVIKATFTATGSPANFTGSTSPTFTQTVAKNTPSVVVTASPTSSQTFGSTITLTGTVTASGGYATAPTGTVTFRVTVSGVTTSVTCTQGAEPRTVSGSGPAVAMCTTKLTGGAKKFKVVYSGNTNFAGKTSAQLTYTVNKYTVAESLTSSSPGTSAAGVPVTYTLTVTGVGTTQPAGTVAFKDGGTTITGCSAKTLVGGGSHTSSVTCLESGTSLTKKTHTITAVYTPSTSNYLAATTPTLHQTVTANATTTTVTAPGTLRSGVAHTWKATVQVHPTTVATTLKPAGTVKFTDKAGTTTVWTCTATVVASSGGISKTATTCTEPATDLTTATHKLTAVYTTSNANFTGSTSTTLTAPVTAQTVAVAITAVPASPSSIATAVTYTATLTATPGSTIAPTGSVTFTDTATTADWWTCTVSTPTTSGGGTATYTCEEPATKITGHAHTITAHYAGNSYFAAATGTHTQSITTKSHTPARVVTSISLGTSNSPGFPGVPITYTATVTGKSIFAPTGSVKFTSNRGGWTKTAKTTGSTTGCTHTTSGVTTSYSCTETTAADLTEGTQTITATFEGDTNYTSAQTSIIQTVTQDSTSLTVKSTPAVATAGASVHFITTVTPSHGELTPTGTIHYSDTATGWTCTSAALVSATAGKHTAKTPTGTTCLETASTYSVGTYPIVAVYYPTATTLTYLSSDNTASPYTLRVGPDSTTTTVTGPSGGPFPAGQPLTFSATVTPTTTSALALTGTVTFSDASGNRCTKTVDGIGAQTVTCKFSSVDFIAGQSDVITATYSGSTNFTTSHGTTTQSGTTPSFKKTTTSTSPTRIAQITIKSSSLAGSPVGQPVTYTVTVSGPNTGKVTPTGTVTFTDKVTGVTVWTCTKTLTAGTAGSATATCTEPATKFTVGTKKHVITVSYGGNTTFKAVTSAAFDQYVLPSATTTGITSASSNATVVSVDTPVTLTATVTSTDYLGKKLTPSVTHDNDGKVDFLLNGVVISTCKDLTVATSVTGLKVTGTATCATYKLPEGTDKFTAVYHDYTGGSGYATSYTTGTTTVPVTHPSPPQSNAEPWSSVTYQVVYFGTVSNVTSSPSTPVTGQPTLLKTTVVPSFGAATLPTDATPIVFTVNGTAVTCSAHGTTTTKGKLSGANPPTASCYVASGLPGGADVVQAAYPSDGVYASSVGSLSMTVAKDSTTTTMKVSTATGTYTKTKGATSGQTLKLSATVTPQSPGSGTPTGTVSFTTPALPGQTLCTAVLSGGKGTCYDTSIPVPAGSPNPVLFQATFSGDTGFSSSVSTVPARTTATLGTNGLYVYKETATVKTFTVSPTAPVYGQSMTFTVTLSPEILTTYATGPVKVSGLIDGVTTTLCTFILVATSDNAGTCTFTPSASAQNYLAAGPEKLTATFSGNSYFSGPAIGNLSTYVSKAKSSTSIVINPQNPIYGQLPTFTVTVTPATSGTIPTGTVKVTGPGTVGTLCTATLSSGSGSCTSTVVVPGQKNATFSATYSGDANFLAASKTGNAGPGTVVANVQQAVTTTAVTVTSTKSYGTTEKFKVTVTPSSVPSPAETGASPIGNVVVTAPGVLQALCTVTNLTATAATIGASKGTCTSTAAVKVPVGTNVHYTAAYAGNTDFLSSSGTTTNSITKATTTTALTVGTASVAYGSETSETLTAAVTSSGGTPTGTVTFKSGSTVLCSSVTLSSGSATCALSATQLAVGTYATLKATYSGSTSFNTSTSTTKSLTVTKATTTTALTVGAASVAYGNEATETLTATVTSAGGTPTGTVTFKHGSTAICSSVALSSGIATCTLTATQLVVGSYTTVTATYPATTNFKTSKSSNESLTVSKATTTTTLAVSPATAVYGNEQAVTLTATVASTTSATPTGTVTFKQNTTTLCASVSLSGGVATCTLTARQLTAGTYTKLTAAYAASTSFNASTSATKSLAVAKEPVTLGLTVKSPGSFAYGAESTTTLFTWTATPLYSGTPTGTVTITANGTTLCSSVAVATDKCKPSSAWALTPGTYTVTAAYTATGSFSSTTTFGSLTITKATSTAGLTLPPTAGTYGDESVLSFKPTAVSNPTGGTTPTGTVTVTAVKTATTYPLCTFTLGGSSTSCSPSDEALPLGTYTIDVVYNGDGNYKASPTYSPGAGTLVISKSSTKPSLEVSESPPSVVYGSEGGAVFSVTALAPVGTGVPTGSVTFKQGATTVCTATLTNGSGSCSPSTPRLLPAAPSSPYTVTGTYTNTDGNFTSGSTATTTLTVTKASTTTVLSITPATATYGDEKVPVISATVTSATTGTPTGTVVVKEGGTTICTLTLSGGTGSCAALATTKLPVATHSLTATYAGDTNFSTSTSSAEPLAVTKAATTTHLTVTGSPASYGKEKTVVLTPSVTVTGTNTATPTGTVTITATKTGTVSPVCTYTLGVGTTCSPATAALPTGTYTLIATYSGSTGLSPSILTPAGTLVIDASAAPMVTLAPITSPVTYGNEGAETFSVTVAAPAGAHATPTGTVTVKSGSTTLCTVTLSAGAGTCTLTAAQLAAGSYSSLGTGTTGITAHYNGDANFPVATSTPAQTLMVTKVPTTTTVATSSTSVVYGADNAAVLTATVTPTYAAAGPVTGTVTIKAGTTVVCTALTLSTADNGTVTCTAAATALGVTGSPYTLTAVFTPVPATNVAGSNGTAAQTLTVASTATASTLVVAPATSAYGTETLVTLSGTVTSLTSGVPTGTGTITNLSTGHVLATVTVTAGTYSTTLTKTELSTGTYSLAFSYAGTGTTFGASTSAAETLTVTQAAAPTVTVTFAKTTVPYGAESTAGPTVTVTSPTGTPTGTVTLTQGTTTLCTITLASGKGTCTLANTVLPATTAKYTVVAHYNGDPNLPAAIATAKLKVTTAPKSTAHVSLVVAPATVAFGNEDAATYTATVTSPEVPAGGTVTITATVAGTATTLCITTTLVNGVASCSPSGQDITLAVGATQTITATYNGDANVTGGAKGTAALTVASTATASTLVVAPATSAYGTETLVTLSGTVTSLTSGVPTGTGTITNLSTGHVLATVTVTAGTYSTTLTKTELSTGTYSLAFSYAGTGTTFGASTSAAETLTVTQASTTTTLTLTPSSTATYGSEGALTLKTTVTSLTGATPVGTVVVTSGTTTLCTITLSAGTGTCQLGATQLPAAVYPLKASYAGNTNFGPSSDSSKTLTVDQAAAPTVTLSFSPTTVAYGAEGTAVPTVHVTSTTGTPTGTVTLKQGTTTLCTVTLSAGTGTCTLANTVLPVGAYTGATHVVATYNGDANFPAGATGTASLTVSKAATTTKLSVAPAAVTYGAEDAAVYTVTVTSTTTGTPTGTVTVKSGTTTLCTVTLSVGTGTCTGSATALVAGTYTGVTATYATTASFAGSSSAPAALLVRSAPTTTSLALSMTTVIYGEEHLVTFSSTVASSTSGTPGGTVVVSTGSTTLCTITLIGGTGTCTASNTALTVAASPYSVVATYEGQAVPGFLGSVSTSRNLTVIQATTSTSSALSITPATVPYGDEQVVKYDVTVSPQGGGTPTGKVTVTTGSTTICTFTLVAIDNGKGSCMGPDLLLPASAISYQVKAAYAGDNNFHSSVSPTQPLKVIKATTTTAVALSPTTVTYGAEQHEVFTATVTPQFAGVPTGTVTVKSGSTVLCTVTLAGATGTCSPAGLALSAGSRPITATYNGDGNFNGSTTATASTLTVAKAGSTTALTISPSTVAYGSEQTAVFKVTVTPSTSGVPTGTATVKVGSTTLCTVTLSGGAGTCTTTSTALPVSSGDQVIASYGGDQNFDPSTSPPASLTVGPPPTVVTVASSANPSNPGKTVTFTATVAAPAPGAGTPAGTVTFTEGSTTLCSKVSLSNGVGTCTTSLPVTPTQTIDVAYAGNATYQPSSTTYAQHVLHGYWTVAQDGGVFAFGDTHFYGSMASQPLNKPVVGIAATADAGGYWLVAADGGIFNFGDAQFYGSTGSMHLNAPVVGMEPTPDGKGYWLVAADGGLFAFGDAPFYGSMGGQSIPSPVVGMVSTSNGLGYWEVAADGSVYAFGDASFEGSASHVTGTVVGLAPMPDGKGYWLATSSGGVYSFGDAQYYGSAVGMSTGSPIVGIGSTFDGGGYWLVAANGGVFSFGDAVYDGSMSLSPLHAPMVSIADM